MEKDIMANHVYYNIDIDSTEEGLKAFEDTLVTTTKTQLNWEQKEIKIEELADIHTLAFMPDAGELDEYENQVDGYNWYCDNVGAKWCYIEEWSDTNISGYSAWSAPIFMAEHIARFIGKTDPAVSISMTYEDEYRNFIGVARITLDEDMETDVDLEETDGDEITEKMRKHFNLSEEDIEDEDFDLWEELETSDGNKYVPGEYMDDLVYEFFNNNR